MLRLSISCTTILLNEVSFSKHSRNSNWLFESSIISASKYTIRSLDTPTLEKYRSLNPPLYRINSLFWILYYSTVHISSSLFFSPHNEVEVLWCTYVSLVHRIRDSLLHSFIHFSQSWLIWCSSSNREWLFWNQISTKWSNCSFNTLHWNRNALAPN